MATDRPDREVKAEAWRSGRRNTRIAMVLLAVVVGVWSYTAVRYFSSAQNSIEELQQSDAFWSGSQTLEEYRAFTITLHDMLLRRGVFAGDDRAAQQRELAKRTAALWGRINQFEGDAALARRLREAESLHEGVVWLKESLLQAEYFLNRIPLDDPEQLRATLVDLQAVAPALVRGVGELHELDQDHTNAAEHNVRFGRRMILIATAAALLAISFILAFILRDTQRARMLAERNLELARVAEAGRKAKADFLTTTSHEIRTPLNGILGMLTALEDRGLRRDQRTYARIARSSASSLLALLSQILDDARLDEDRLNLDEGPEEIRRLVGEVCVIVAPQAWDAALEISAYLSPELPERIITDGPRLRQIILNLTGNAVKFTQHGGVMIRVFPVGAAQAQQRFRIEVSDSGPGVPETEKDDVFRRFTQSRHRNAKMAGGSGLGLSIASRLAKAFGGEMGVRDRIGGGSVFWYEGPLRPAPVGKRAAGAPADLSDQNVLLIRRAHEGPSATAEALRAAGAVVREAHSRDQTLDIIDREAFTAFVVVADAESAFKTVEGLMEIAAVRRSNARIAVIRLDAPQPDLEERLVKRGVLVASPPLGAVVKTFLQTGQVEDEDDAPEVPEHALGGVRALIAEDQPINQMVVKMHMERAGAQPIIVDDCQIAVERSKQSVFDVIILDLHTPRMSGAEATRAIRAGSLNNDTPIIALTADATAAAQADLREAGVDVFATKPISREDLIARILSVVEHPPSPTLAPAPEPEPQESDAPDDFGDFAASELNILASKLRAALTKEDADAAAAAAHAAIGALAVIGLSEEADLARMVEDAAKAREEEWGDLSSDLAEMLDAAADSLRQTGAEIPA